MREEMIYNNKTRLQKLSDFARPALVPFAMVVIWATCLGLAQPVSQQTFPSAMEASKSLFMAVRENQGEKIVKILGGPTELASSGDKNQDKLDRERFVQKYQEMHRMVREDDGKVTLYIGAENWPFPIPLVEKDGAWRFDPDAGMKEVLFRRIGENELTAIATCRDFAAQNRDRAKSTASIPADSFMATLAAKAGSESTANDTVIFHGYYFHVLPGKAAGGFTLIAHPAEYRSSGVMTFVLTANGVVYEKDLGANSSALADAMKAFHKDATWHAATE